MKSDTFTLHTMEIEDYPQVFDLWKRCEGVGIREEVDSETGIQRYLTRNPGMSFIARTGDRIVGAVLAGHDGRRGYIHHLAVDPQWRKKGIGTRLVSAAIETLRKEGIGKVHLFVFKENESAQKFWEKLGWEIREDILIMSRNFSAV